VKLFEAVQRNFLGLETRDPRILNRPIDNVLS
jgi:hypothetical protein